MRHLILGFLVSLCLLQGCLGVPHEKRSSRASKTLEWWQQSVVYQIYPRSFQDSDGDGVGDLNGITSRLDYFVELGIDAIWISPIMESPMKDFGYDISNFTNIDPIFGTLDDFRRMSEEFRKRDIKLIMDMVPNHSSDQHEYFKKSVQRVDPYTDYYVWRNATGTDPDGKPIPPNNWLSVFAGSAWEWNDQRQQFYLHQFVHGRVRCMMVEANVPDEYVDDYYGTPDKPVSHFPFNFHLLLVNPESNATEVLNLINVWYDVMPENAWPTFLLGNHDQKRAPTRWSEAWRHGSYESQALNSDKVLAFTRVPPRETGQWGYVVLINLSKDDIAVDARSFSSVPTLGVVRARSVGFHNPRAIIGSAILTQSVELGARDAIVIEYPPVYA
ncbi:unnamed protein product [Allacma fusca]|uniref:alpha-glucosidase n=1 Tax=Allacma fusca TaxID=39272 RepID=A0A8J2PFH9_9HEXA|nr:unnamed protein product [Allacma fusca]